MRISQSMVLDFFFLNDDSIYDDAQNELRNELRNIHSFHYPIWALNNITSLDRKNVKCTSNLIPLTVKVTEKDLETTLKLVYCNFESLNAIDNYFCPLDMLKRLLRCCRISFLFIFLTLDFFLFFLGIYGGKENPITLASYRAFGGRGLYGLLQLFTWCTYIGLSSVNWANCICF